MVFQEAETDGVEIDAVGRLILDWDLERWCLWTGGSPVSKKRQSNRCRREDDRGWGMRTRWMKRKTIDTIVQVIKGCSCSQYKISSFELVVNHWQFLRSFGVTDMKGDLYWERWCRCRQGWTTRLLEWREWMRFPDFWVHHVAYEVSPGVESYHHHRSESQCPYQNQSSRGVFDAWFPISFLVQCV